MNEQTLNQNTRYFRVSSKKYTENDWNNKFFDDKDEASAYANEQTLLSNMTTVTIERVIDLETFQNEDNETMVKVLIKKVTWGSRRKAWARMDDTSKVMRPKREHVSAEAETNEQFIANALDMF